MRQESDYPFVLLLAAKQITGSSMRIDGGEIGGISPKWLA
jgi:hypothetical protein